jgi:hypothetical protein
MDTVNCFHPQLGGFYPLKSRHGTIIRPIGGGFWMVVSIYLGFDRRDFALKALPRLTCEDLWVMYSTLGEGLGVREILDSDRITIVGL